MEKIRQIIATYKAMLFINHDKKQTTRLSCSRHSRTEVCRLAVEPSRIQIAIFVRDHRPGLIYKLRVTGVTTAGHSRRYA